MAVTHNYEKVQGEPEEHNGAESTPFLDTSFTGSGPGSPTQADVDSLAEKKAQRFRARVTFLIALLIVAVDLPAVMFNASLVRILESIYCKSFYTEHDPSKILGDGTIPEELCKIPDVQTQLSSLRGWTSFWTHLPGLFLAVPFGMLADKYGRKWLFVMNILSMQGRTTWQYVVCSFPNIFPLKAIWFEAILACFGGGSMVATALIFVTLSDVTPTSAMASTFFRLGAANMLCFTIGPPIAAAIMQKDPWLAFTLGLILQAVAIPISLAMPETLGAKRPGEAPKKEEKLDTPSSDIFEKDFRSHGSRVIKFIKDNAGFIAKDWRVLFFASTYPIRMCMNSLDGQVLQYVPQRFHWTIANTTNLQALQSGVAMAVLLLILPTVSSYLMKKRGFSTNRKDILLTRFGFFCYGAGLITIGFAPTIFFFVIGMITVTLAAGSGAAVRALLTSWVQQNEVARLYTALGIIETLGSICGGPLISNLYNAGVRAHGDGAGDLVLGIPWIAAGTIMIGLAILTLLLRFTDKNEVKKDTENSGYQRTAEDDFEASELAPTVGFPPALQTPTVPITPRTPHTPYRSLLTPRSPRTPYRMSEKYN